MKKLYLLLSLFILGSPVAIAQTNPVPQSLPFSEDFDDLVHSSTAWPDGFQGWRINNVGPSDTFFVVPAQQDRGLTANGDASSTGNDVYNFNQKLGFRSTTGGNNFMVLALNTLGFENIQFSYDIMTIRNLAGEDAVNWVKEVGLQYRIGTSGDFINIPGTLYQNPSALVQTEGTEGQSIQNISITLPEAVENQPVVQLRWVKREVSGSAGNNTRPSFAIDNVEASGSEINLNTFYYAGSGDLNDTQNWSTNENGIGGSQPANFTNDDVEYVITNTANVTLDSAWNVSGDNSFVSVGNSTVAVNFVVLAALNADVQVQNNATLLLGNSVIPDFVASEGSTLVFSGDATNIPYGNYHNLIFDNINPIFEIVEDPSEPGELISGVINVTGDLTLSGTVTMPRSRGVDVADFDFFFVGDGNQSINGGSNLFRCYEFNVVKTSGEFNLNTAISSDSQLNLNVSGVALFKDNGNTIYAGNSVNITGDEASYELTGTLVLADEIAGIINGSGDGNNFNVRGASNSEQVVAQLNNLTVQARNTGGQFRFREGLRVMGDLTLGSQVEGDLRFYNAAVVLHGNFTVENGFNGDIVEANDLIFSGNAVQTISLDEDFHFENLLINKSEGSVELDATNTGRLVLNNNLEMNLSGSGERFVDNGNTIVYGDELILKGTAENYTLTGTIELNASGGSNDFEDVVAELNNLRIVTSGDARPRFRDDSNFEAVVVIKGNLELEMNSSRDLFLNDVELQIGGDFINNSTSGIRRGESKLVFNGSSNQEISTSQRLDLHVVEFDNSSATILAGEPIAIRDHLKLTSGNLTVNDNNLVFISDEDFTAYLAPVGATASISGNVETQRYIPAGENETRAFRFVASSVDAGSIRENWQEDGASIAGFGTHITGVGGASNGFDATASNASSMFAFDNDVVTQSNGNAWVAVENTTATNLVAGTPYRLFVRGDRTIDLTSNDSSPENTTLRAKGDLKTGNQAIGLGSNPSNFVFVGNPYQAVVDMNQITFNGVENGFMYAWDPNTNEGTYVVVALDGSAPNPSSSGASRYLQPGQAVFLRTNPDAGAKSVTFNEASKVVDNQSLATFSDNTIPFLNIRIYETERFNAGLGENDALGLRFLADGNNNIDSKDAVKLGNPGINFATINGNTPLSIESRTIPQQEELVPLFLNNLTEENYTFRFHYENMPTTVKAFINDSYLNTKIEIEEGINSLSFEVDAGINESISPLRFFLSFEEVSLSNEEFDFATEIAMYPNPASTTINVNAQLLVDQAFTVNIYNVLGKNVISEESPANEYGSLQINVAKLPRGVYVLTATTKEGVVFNKKFIKK